MILRVRFPEREDALRGNVELVNEHDQRIAIGHLQVDGPLSDGHVEASVRFVGHVEQPLAAPASESERLLRGPLQTETL